MKNPTLFCDDGAEIELPFAWSICSTCSGHGKSSAYLGAITQGDRQAGGIWECSETFNDYMNGAYDRTCDRCDGLGRVKVADHSRMTKQQRADYAEQRRGEREDRAVERMERMMGA